MPEEVAAISNKLVGTKQVLRALPKVRKIVLAKDADTELLLKIEQEAKKHNVPVEYVPSKKELGDLCEISVHCACVGIL